MHFDQRTQHALRDVGLETEEFRAASTAVVETVGDDAEVLEDGFTDGRRRSDWNATLRPHDRTRVTTSPEGSR